MFTFILQPSYWNDQVDLRAIGIVTVINHPLFTSGFETGVVFAAECMSSCELIERPVLVRLYTSSNGD